MEVIESQNKMILEHLQSGKTITPIKALKLFGCFRLGARIWDLKREGYTIISKLVHDPKTGKRYAQYCLVP